MKTLQVRNVPDDVHRALKVRAAAAGRSLSDLVLEELRRVTERPTRQEILTRLTELPPIALDPSAADAVRAERDRR